MKYLFYIFLFSSLFSCAHKESTTETVSPKQEVAEVIDSNMLASPQEMIDEDLLADSSKPLPWFSAGINDPNQLKIFIKFLRFWVEKGNVDSIAAHIAYPLTHPNIKNRENFVKNYHQYFNSKVINALNNQKLPQIYRDNKGARIGTGELWIRNISKENIEEFKITAINN